MGPEVPAHGAADCHVLCALHVVIFEDILVHGSSPPHMNLSIFLAILTRIFRAGKTSSHTDHWALTSVLTMPCHIMRCASGTFLVPVISRPVRSMTSTTSSRLKASTSYLHTSDCSKISMRPPKIRPSSPTLFGTPR